MGVTEVSNDGGHIINLILSLDELTNRTLSSPAKQGTGCDPVAAHISGRAAVAKVSQAIDIEELAASLPRRVHAVMDHYAAETPDHVALIDDEMAWSYRELDKHVGEIAHQLSSFGIRAGDRMMIVSENCIPLAALLLAASRLDAWAIVANPRLAPREIDQIRAHSGARRVFFTTAVSKEAAAHAGRLGAEMRTIGPLKAIGITGPKLADCRGARGRGAGTANRRSDVYVGHDRHAEGRDVIAPKSADQRRDDSV